MDTLKKPETIISLVNTAALLGASIHFYRRINGLEEELNTQSDHLTATIKKVKELQVNTKNIKSLAAAIRSLDGIINAQNNEIGYLKSLSNYQRDQIRELQARASEENGAEFKLTREPFQQVQPARVNPPAQQFAQPQQQFAQPQQQFAQPQQQFAQPQQQFGQPQQPFAQPQQQFGQPQQQFGQPQQQFGQPQQFQQFHQQSPPPQNQQQISSPPYMNQGGINQGMNQGINQSDLLDFNDPTGEDDLDMQIDAVRRARNQGGSQNQNQGLMI